METFYDSLIHVSYVLLLLAWLVRDVIKLRLLAIASTAAWIGYCVTHDNLVESALWSTLFMVVNTGQVVRALRERRAVQLSDEERDLQETVFSGFSPVEFMRLVQHGEWTDGSTGEVLVAQGEQAPGLIYLARGAANVEVDGETRLELRPLSFVGEMSYVTGEAASATVRLGGAGRYLIWKRADLERLFGKYPTIGAAFQSVVSVDLARKLRQS